MKNFREERGGQGCNGGRAGGGSPFPLFIGEDGGEDSLQGKRVPAGTHSPRQSESETTRWRLPGIYRGGIRGGDTLSFLALTSDGYMGNLPGLTPVPVQTRSPRPDQVGALRVFFANPREEWRERRRRERREKC